MADVYKTVYKPAQGQIEEKKSKFIATVCSASTKEDAEQFIAEVKKKYPDARHNCSAYILGEEGQIMHSSDDGEPAGTAGKPMLEVLMGEGLTNTAVVVTRYFGGILLGTGGLVRAYTQATKAGLMEAGQIEKRKGYSVNIILGYTDVGKMQYLVRQHGYTELSCQYEADVKYCVLVDKSAYETFEKQLTESFSGRIMVADKSEVLYGIYENKPIIF